MAILDQALSGTPAALQPAELAGDWRCRTLKLGGLSPLTVYGEFRCRITDGPEGLRLEKLTGSQRTSGVFYDLGETKLGYAGAQSIAGETKLRYGQDARADQVGYLVPLSPSHLRLELPLPRLESHFDILDLRR